MQFIDIFNFKKYFRKNGDNAPAKVGHVNSLFPLVITDTPQTLNLIPKFVGQIAVQPNDNKVWIAYNETDWTFILLD